MRVDRRLCEAIVALRPSTTFEYLIEAIREDAAEALAACGSAEGNVLLRAQGKYQALKGWLDIFESAREYLEKPGLK